MIVKHFLYSTICSLLLALPISCMELASSNSTTATTVSTPNKTYTLVSNDNAKILVDETIINNCAFFNDYKAGFGDLPQEIDVPLSKQELEIIFPYVSKDSKPTTISY